MWGSDHVASVEPIGVWKLVKGIRDVEKSLGEESSFYAGIGDGRKLLSGEKSKRKSLRK